METHINENENEQKLNFSKLVIEENQPYSMLTEKDDDSHMTVKNLVDENDEEQKFFLKKPLDKETLMI